MTMQAARDPLPRVQHEFNALPDDRGLRICAIRVRVALKRRLHPWVLACALLLVAAASPARTPPPPPPRPSAPAPAPSRPSSLEQAVKQVQHRTGGHILAADTVSRGKANVYRIKVLTPQGQVKVVQLHSDTRPKPKPRKPDSNQGGH